MFKASEAFPDLTLQAKKTNGLPIWAKEIIQNLITETSKLLSSSQSPFFGGLGLDILGSRSVIKLAKECNATIDHCTEIPFQLC